MIPWDSRKVTVICLLLCITHVRNEPISMSIAVGTAFALSAGLSGYQYFKCKLYECCTDNWITFNANNLKEDLKRKLYGQHLVIETVVRALKAHVKSENPSKALVFSFHGWTGIVAGGKNYVSEIIARNFFLKGKSSQYVKLYLPDLHLYDNNFTKHLATELQTIIKMTVSSCPRSLFLFDEVDKIPSDIISAVKPFIDYHKVVQGIDYSKSIFIFMSNTGGNDINTKYYEFWRKGIPRESVKLSDVEDVIIKAAFNEDGGLKYSELIKHNLIDHFVPFLPMERSHVRLCIKDYLRTKNYTFSDKVEEEEKFIAKISDSLPYFPKGPELFSSSGCKRVKQKVDLGLEELREKDEEQNDQL